MVIYRNYCEMSELNLIEKLQKVNPYLMGAIIFALNLPMFPLWLFLFELMGFDMSSRCDDGWRSSSIGTRGACSFHGGVYVPAANIIILHVVGAIIVPFLISFFSTYSKRKVNLNKVNLPRPNKKSEQQSLVPDSSAPICPRCDTHMAASENVVPARWVCVHNCQVWFKKTDFPPIV